MNAAIRAVVRTASVNGARVTGFVGGYAGLVNDRTRLLGPRDVSNIIQRGGTMLHTARSAEFLTTEGRTRAAEVVRRHGIDGLVVIGGDGTFAGADVLFQEHGIPAVGIPGTIDNDLSGTDRSIGYDTAINTAVEAIDRIRDTASSHDRLFFVEVMGRDSGAIALDCAVAAGAEFVLVPEREESTEQLIRAILGADGTKSSSIVVVAEGEIEGGAFVVAQRVKERLPSKDIRVTVIGHDRVLASRLGVAAVGSLLRGEHGGMVGMINGQVAFTPFRDAIQGKRELDPELFRVLNILAT
jgi:6-phosphofructokinase 1